MTEDLEKTFSPCIQELLTIAAHVPGHGKVMASDFCHPSQSSVDDHLFICISNLEILYINTIQPLVPIVDRKFAFTGSFYASGSFSTATNVSGVLGLKSYYIPGCGYVSGGPFSWSAAWLRSGQPDPLAGIQVDPFFLPLPELKAPFPGTFSIDLMP
jgi:hypothetical protein